MPIAPLTRPVRQGAYGGLKIIICCRLGLRHSGICQFVKGKPASYPTRLIIRWSPNSRVFSMEAEGMKRAWPIVPLTNRKTRPTQNQARISLRTRALTDERGWEVAVFVLTFSLHRVGFGNFSTPPGGVAAATQLR